MKRLIPLITFLAALTLSQAAQGQAQLRAKATVMVDVITLGDLFTGIDDLADQEVGPAPGLGQRAIYKADHLAALARAHGLDWKPASRAARVIITRGGETVSESEIIELLTAEFRQQGALGRVKVQLNRLRMGILRSPEGRMPRIENLSFDSDGGAFRASIRSDFSNGEVQSQALRGRVDFVARVPVPSRSIRKGQEITQADIKWTELNIRVLSSETIEHPDQIIGLAASRNLRQNQPLKPSDLREPVIVAKGTVVTVSLKSGGLSLSGMGRALEDGSQGEIIRIMNLQSKRTVDASVIGPNQVVVELRRRIAVVANR
ncbi:MAG: flagellar basal body P-ring formation protein FlgA [Rhodospirillaceae bacterium]|jgi:flagellar basal body P-ring formation protein FlgA|nr:flagellar basal body P-ring formation protein FlgA [Rhodospirillaceae bacterium]MBT4490132.1 flagellar basal body P-ring formation protein FlgA [Rhodospirillaceae bacterium]MBT5049656.1 flagellar basal body P-ring formation protein FlgA [Rhodospirillaceae bacterium]MBT6430516.1 flagellar basal body P-ring formation protein FlgA [Rhodospirillaceae bacterium]MBT7757432.1 flagellar basal body P-ring formation protein FlgA [Rhodospirillaceae bacterium]